MISDERIIEEAIRLVDEGVSVTLPVNGNSMLPFIIGGRESVILTKPATSISSSGQTPSDGRAVQIGDVVLAWADGCRYVVHRIIRIEGDNVILMGDGNLSGMEYCTLSDIKAIVTHVVDAKERAHFLYCKWRKSAAKAWFWLRPFRRYLLAIYRRI